MIPQNNPNPDPEYPDADALDRMSNDELEALWKKHDPKRG